MEIWNPSLAIAQNIALNIPKIYQKYMIKMSFIRAFHDKHRIYTHVNEVEIFVI